VSFAFNCRLGTDTFNVAVAVHSADGISFDWLDGALFFQVMSATAIEGVANLDATVTARRLGVVSTAVDGTNVNVA
jgi:lipopolysaccharide transport system ATP-binding protein